MKTTNRPGPETRRLTPSTAMPLGGMPESQDQAGSLSIAGFSLSKCGIVPNGNPSFEDWQTLGQWLRFAEGAVHWWIGDWLNYGEQKWGEMYAQAIDATGFDYETLKADKWVSAKIELVRRRTNLSWSHHQEVAAMEPKDQDELLSGNKFHRSPKNPGRRLLCPKTEVRHLQRVDEDGSGASSNAC